MTLVPLRCTSNVYGNIDYGIPILFKQTDYRTSTGTGHKHIPEIPQQFTRTIISKFPESNAESDQATKNYCTKTTYNENFHRKQCDTGIENSCPKSKHLLKVHYFRELQEKLFTNPPRPIAPKNSETKDEYLQKESNLGSRTVYPPNPYLVCKLYPPGDSPSLDPDKEGYMKWMDPYLSTYRAAYVPISTDKRKQYIQPKIGSLAGANEPLCSSQEPVYDKAIFRKPVKDRIVHVAPVGFSASKTSTYRSSYIPHTWSNAYTRINCLETEYPESNSRSSAWQDLCPPGMYCTEQCHLGTGWPISSVMNLKEEQLLTGRLHPHKSCNVKCCKN